MSHTLFPWRDAFLAALREYPVLTHACEVVGIDRSTAFRARQDNPDFAKAVEDAMEAGIDRAEQEAFNRAVDGWREPVFYQGQQCGEVLKKSDAMLSLVLKGRRKAIYADRTELTGANGGAVAIDDHARAARLAYLLDKASKARDAESFG